MYGKTIFKPIETDTVINNSQHDFGKYVSLNNNYIDSVLEVNGRYCIKEVESVMSHYNYVHAGVEILSMSKRIMNKVFEVSNDCGVKTYYQDIDFIHLNYDDVDIVVNRYNETYNQDFVGQGLGNFHVYFSMDGAVSETYGNESYFLGKHTYLGMLESTKGNNLINGKHIRMIGVPAACIKYYAEQKR